MKNYSRDTLNRYIKDLRDTKDEWMKKWSEHVEYMAKYKENGSIRSKEYVSVGIMDLNDIIQESYLAFLTAWNNVNWDDINKSTNPEASLWSYLKKTANLNLNISIRNNKDGIRITQYGLFQSKEAQNTNVQMITSLFHQLDKMFMNVEENEENFLTYEAELLGFFLDTHFDDVLDRKSNGERSLKGIERDVIKKLFGIESELGTYKELSEYYKVSVSSLHMVKKRALEKLKSPMSMKIISDFVKEYRLTTSSNADTYELI